MRLKKQRGAFGRRKAGKTVSAPPRSVQTKTQALICLSGIAMNGIMASNGRRVIHKKVHAPLIREKSRIPKRDTWILREATTMQIVQTFPSGAAAHRAAEYLHAYNHTCYFINRIYPSASKERSV